MSVGRGVKGSAALEIPHHNLSLLLGPSVASLPVLYMHYYNGGEPVHLLHEVRSSQSAAFEAYFSTTYQNNVQ